MEGKSKLPPQTGNFTAAHQNVLCASTEDGGSSCSEAQDGRTRQISSPVQDGKSYVYIRVRSVCGGSWNEKTQNHYTVLAWGKVWNPCHFPPPINMGCLLGILGKILISSLKGSHAVKKKPASLKFRELFAITIIAQGQQTQLMQTLCPLCSARASPREAPGCSSSKASQK